MSSSGLPVTTDSCSTMFTPLDSTGLTTFAFGLTPP